MKANFLVAIIERYPQEHLYGEQKKIKILPLKGMNPGIHQKLCRYLTTVFVKHQFKLDYPITQLSICHGHPL